MMKYQNNELKDKSCVMFAVNEKNKSWEQIKLPAFVFGDS